MGKIDRLTFLGKVMVEKILEAKLCSTEDEAIQLILNEWESKAMQDVLHGYKGSRERA